MSLKTTTLPLMSGLKSFKSLPTCSSPRPDIIRSCIQTRLNSSSSSSSSISTSNSWSALLKSSSRQLSSSAGSAAGGGSTLFFAPSFSRSTFPSSFASGSKLKARSNFFQPSHRFYSTTIPVDAASRVSVETSEEGLDESRTVIPRSLPNWLIGCSALVFGIIVIGGLTRLTESGLSITEWEPFKGVLPPITKEQWDVEWEKYKVSPEGIMTNSKLEMNEFKKIFYMEWAHRIAGRTLGLAFVIPTIYYVTRYRLPRTLQAKLLAIGLGIGFQGFLGWYMVQSGLEQEIIDTNSVPRVSQYRLAAHLSAALTLYIGMVHTALSLRREMKLDKLASSTTTTARQGLQNLLLTLNNSSVKRYRRIVGVAGAMVLFTAVSGAFVAGLDAGLVYNEFPYMGENIIPPVDELMDKRYARAVDGSDNWWRNMLENPVTAQFDHRLFAITTFAVLLHLPIIARRKSLRSILPRSTQNLAKLTAAAAITQVTLGITTLLYLVPIPLAAMHQAGSVVLLTCLLGLGASLKRPSASVLARLQRHAAAAAAAAAPLKRV